DKKKSNEIIRNLSNDFKYEEFNKKILENLEKDIDALKSRINFYPSSLQSFINF
ncbi:glycosyltransferase family 2 protein, partial [Campylobacter jejuni]|nr:glycosyltransferase family 2 protein [Campylobacter jejuni]